jgi:hypothetical protein
MSDTHTHTRYMTVQALLPSDPRSSYFKNTDDQTKLLLIFKFSATGRNVIDNFIYRCSILQDQTRLRQFKLWHGFLVHITSHKLRFKCTMPLH